MSLSAPPKLLLPHEQAILRAKTSETTKKRSTQAAELVRAAGSFLRKRVLFGSDYPMISPDRWLSEIEQTELKPEALPGILKDNAARLLQLV